MSHESPTSALDFVRHQIHRTLIAQELGRARAEAEVIGVLLTGSVARGDAAPSSDLDLCFLLRGGYSRAFEAEPLSGILVERKYADAASARATLERNPMEVYAYLDGRILWDEEGGLSALAALANSQFETYKTSEAERQSIAYWLRSAAGKMEAAESVGDDLKAAFVAATTAWKILEGIWAVNDKPMPPSGSVLSHLSDVRLPPHADPAWFPQLFQSDAPTRAESALALIHILLPLLSASQEDTLMPITANSLSFDGLTALYDQTRTFDPACFGLALDWLSAHFPPAQFSSILEPGIGTGRIALALAGRGYSVAGLDISAEMLQVCAVRSRTAARGISCLRADATRLPLSAGTFDLCVAVHLFYFIPDWRRAVREILRVLRPNGALVLLHTGFGAEVPSLNERYKVLAQDLGYSFPTYGVRSTQEVRDYAVSRGCDAKRITEPAWEWTARVSLGNALRHLRSRAYSFTKDVPEAVHQAVMDSLTGETVEAGDRLIEVPNRISIVIVSPLKL